MLPRSVCEVRTNAEPAVHPSPNACGLSYVLHAQKRACVHNWKLKRSQLSKLVKSTTPADPIQHGSTASGLPSALSIAHVELRNGEPTDLPARARGRRPPTRRFLHASALRRVVLAGGARPGLRRSTRAHAALAASRPVASEQEAPTML
eukprot:701444-Pleurochrysis_carterae.AAC.4